MASGADASGPAGDYGNLAFEVKKLTIAFESSYPPSVIRRLTPGDERLTTGDGGKDPHLIAVL